MVPTPSTPPQREGTFSSSINEQIAQRCVAGARNTAGFDVVLHVYDIGPLSKWILNSWSGHENGLGVFHCGVEVLGIEWSFQAMMDCDESDDMTGVVCHKPKSHPRHVYRESVCLGTSPLTATEICNILSGLERDWQARTYHFLYHNCTDFAEALAIGLGAPDPFPNWAHGMAKGGLAKIPIPTKNQGLIPLCCGSWTSCLDKEVSSSCDKPAVCSNELCFVPAKSYSYSPGEISTGRYTSPKKHLNPLAVTQKTYAHLSPIVSSPVKTL